MSSIRDKVCFANVVSVIALFIALGGSAYALGANSVGTNQLKPGAVTTSKIKADAVTGGKVNESTLDTVPSAATVVPGGVRAGTLGQITTASATSGSFPTGQTGSVFVQCPAGTQLISGGGAPLSVDVFTTLSRKSDPNGWRYDATNSSGSPTTITVFAYCLAA